MRFALLVFVLGCLTLPAPAQSEGSEGSDEGSGPDLAKSSPALVLTGLDPVSLLDGREQRGVADFARVHKGFEYRLPRRRTWRHSMPILPAMRWRMKGTARLPVCV